MSVATTPSWLVMVAVRDVSVCNAVSNLRSSTVAPVLISNVSAVSYRPVREPDTFSDILDAASPLSNSKAAP